MNTNPLNLITAFFFDLFREEDGLEFAEIALAVLAAVTISAAIFAAIQAGLLARIQQAFN